MFCAATALVALAPIFAAWVRSARRLAFGIGPLTAATLFVGGAGIEVLLPAHVVDVGLATHRVEEPHAVDHVGEQIDVVADDDETTLVLLKELAQPADRVGVEVVGRLVEQQCGRRAGTGFGRGEQDSRELHSTTLATGERPQRLGQNTFCQAETRADAAGLTLGRIAAERGEPLLELAVAAHRLVAGCVVGDLGHQCLLLLQICEQRVETARRQHPVAREDIEVTLSGILWQITDVAGACDRARVGFALPREDAHRGGLACTVAADQTDPVAGLHPQRSAFGGEQRARAGADLQVRCGDHAALSLILTCRR